ncbi:MAG: elongation factor P [Deltaproteobacteria bacterium]|nr:elongation factor P [Deltaproteobacteria bacterium]
MTVATKIKKGNIIVLDGELFKVLKLTHITPGKGNAVVQADLRGVKSHVKTNKRFRSSEDIETAEIKTQKMQYLYSENDTYFFMDQENYEQYELGRELIDDAIHYIIPDNIYDVAIYDDAPIGLELPPRVTIKVAETDPSQKGVQGKTKPAKSESGLVVKVPLFIQEGESIVVNTETGEYIERA